MNRINVNTTGAAAQCAAHFDDYIKQLAGTEPTADKLLDVIGKAIMYVQSHYFVGPASAGLLIDVLHAHCDDWLHNELDGDNDEAQIEPARELQYSEGGPEVPTI